MAAGCDGTARPMQACGSRVHAAPDSHVLCTLSLRPVDYRKTVSDFGNDAGLEGLTARIGGLKSTRAVLKSRARFRKLTVS